MKEYVVFDNQIKTFESIKAKVKELVDEKHYTRGDYRLLDAMYLTKYHAITLCRYNHKFDKWLPISFGDIRLLPSFESVNRAFRLMQSDHAPSLRVQEKRRIRQMRLRKYLKEVV